MVEWSGGRAEGTARPYGVRKARVGLNPFLVLSKSLLGTVPKQGSSWFGQME